MSKENITRRISIFVNGQEVENSLKKIDGATVHLRNQLRLLDLSTEEGRKKFAELKPEYDKAREAQEQYRQELGLTQKAMDDGAGSFAKFRDGLLSGDFASAKEGLMGIRGELTNLVKTSLAFIATPLGAAIAVLGGIVVGTKAIFDFNQEAEKSAQLIENLSGKTGQVVEDIRIQMKALTDTFGISFDQLAGAVDNLVDTDVAKDEFEALEKIKNGLLTAPDKNEFIASLEASAVTAKQVGLSLEEVIALKKEIEETGVDPEATFGALQKASQKLKEQTDTLRKSLTDAFGAAFTDEVLAKVKTGQISTVQALDLISKKSKQVGLDQTQQAQLSVQLFGKAGLAAGGFATVLDTVTGGLKKQKEELNANQKALLQLNDANEKLNKAQSELFRVKDFGELWTKIKANAIDALASMLTYISDLKKDIQPLIDFIGFVLVNAWINLKLGVVNAFAVIGAVVKIFFDNLKFSFDFIKAIITGDFKGALDLLKNYFVNLGDTVGNVFNKIKNNVLTAIQGIVTNIAPVLKALGMDVDAIQKKIESWKSKEVVLKTSTSSGKPDDTEPKNTKSLAEELAKQKALRDAARQKEADARQKALEKKRAEEEKAAKEELDRYLALAKAKADLAKAELNYFVANNRSKLDDTKKLTPEIIVEEANRLNAIKDRQLLALDEENVNRVKDASAKAKSAEELATIIETIGIDYETKRIELTAQTDAQILANKKALEEQEKQLKAEQLVADNELALAEADTQYQADTIKQKQDYDAQIKNFDDLLKRKVISEDEYRRFKDAADKQQKEIEKNREIQGVQGTLGALDTLAGALGEMFGQSKELALAQAGLSGAQAIMSIWTAPYVLPPWAETAIRVGLTAATVLRTGAQIKNMQKEKAPKKPKFFYGGYTGNTAHYGYDEYGPMTGMVHDEEYVIPKAMTQSPRYANTIAWLENERTGKNTRKFADGGATSPGVIPDSVMAEKDSEMKSLLRAVLYRLENPVAPNLLVGYDHAKAIQDLNDERASSDQNATVSE
jgi:hypothetical protein